MKLIQIPCEGIKKAKKLLISKEYYIALSGQRVTFMDHSFNIIKVLEKFSYAYDGYVSPDEKYLLLVPTNSKHFYLISLETLDVIKRVQIKNGMETREGRGCWSLDGRYMLLLVQHPNTFAFEVRFYDVNDPTFYTIADIPATKFFMADIMRVPEHNAYYILAKPRQFDCMNIPPLDNVLLKCVEDGYEVVTIDGHNEVPISLDYNPKTDRFTVCTTRCTFTCASDGKNVSVIDTGHENYSEPTLFSPVTYIVKHIVVSKNGKYIFMASTSGFDIFDKKTGEVLLFKEYVFGATRITELEENLIAVALFHGSMRIFRIEE